jgi:hypothetical protein
MKGPVANPEFCYTLPKANGSIIAMKGTTAWAPEHGYVGGADGDGDGDGDGDDDRYDLVGDIDAGAGSDDDVRCAFVETFALFGWHWFPRLLA